MNFIPELSSVNLAGDWYSRYELPEDSGNVVLSLSETGSDGNVSGVYSFTPDKSQKDNLPGSYEVSGTINRELLYLTLDADDGTQKHVNIDVIYDVDNDCLKGTGHESCDLKAEDLIKLLKDTILFAKNCIEEELLLDVSPVTCVLKPEVDALRTPDFDLSQKFQYLNESNPFSYLAETDNWTYSDYAGVLGSYIFYWEEESHPDFFGNMELINEGFMKRFFEYDVFDFDTNKIENFELAGVEDQQFLDTLFPINYDLSFDYDGIGYRALITNANGSYRVIDVIKDNVEDEYICRRDKEEVNPGMNVKPIEPEVAVIPETPKQDPISDIDAFIQSCGGIDPNAPPIDPAIMGLSMEEKLQLAKDNELTLEEVYSSPIIPNAY